MALFTLSRRPTVRKELLNHPQAMERLTWQWVPSIPSGLFALALLSAFMVWFLASEGLLLQWYPVLVAFFLVAGIVVYVPFFWIPFRFALSEEGLWIGYIHRRGLLQWSQIDALRTHVDRTWSVEIGNGKIRLGNPGKKILKLLIQETRRRNRPVLPPTTDELGRFGLSRPPPED